MPRAGDGNHGAESRDRAYGCTVHATGSASPPQLLLGDLEQALLSCAKRVLGRARSATPGRQVERAGYYTLATLEHCGESRLSDLAATLELDLSTVSRQVRLLEAAGLLDRTPDPHDGRASLLRLSAAGDETLAEQRRQRHVVLDRATSAWPPGDRQHLLDLLERLSAGLDADATARTNREAPA